jgi:hypothetical protein
LPEAGADVLRLFVRKVEYLESLSFVGALSDPGSKLTMDFTGSSLTGLRFAGPSREQIDAFVLTMRLFMQNNDRISIANVAKTIEALELPAELKQPFFECRSILNEYLDSPCSAAPDNPEPTNRQVLETVMYGELCHIDAEARQCYLAWTDSPFAARFLEMQFVAVAKGMLSALRAMAVRCQRIVDWSGHGDESARV